MTDKDKHQKTDGSLPKEGKERLENGLDDAGQYPASGKMPGKNENPKNESSTHKPG